MVETVDMVLEDLGLNFSLGIDTVTLAIYGTQDVEIGDSVSVNAAIQRNVSRALDVEALTIKQQNQLLANVIRLRCAKDGFMSAWACLVEAAPNIGLHLRLVEDVQIAANVYERLKRGTPSCKPIDLQMSIGSQATYDSIYCIGPKCLGGNSWKFSDEYKEFLKNPAWSDSGYSKGIPPCVVRITSLGVKS
jgi:hypothetical protein